LVKNGGRTTESCSRQAFKALYQADKGRSELSNPGRIAYWPIRQNRLRGQVDEYSYQVAGLAPVEVEAAAQTGVTSISKLGAVPAL
jgi:hypothetical protein